MLELIMRHKLFATILAAYCINAIALPEDQYQPIEIHADSATRDEKQGLTTYQGNVFMKQGSLQVDADTIVVRNTGNTASNLTAQGKPAQFQQRPEANKDIVFASANTIVYLLDDGKIELTGQALLKQGEAKISSDKIIYLSNEQLFTAEKSSNGGSTPSQRVQVIIPAKKRPETSTDSKAVIDNIKDDVIIDNKKIEEKP